MGKFYLFLWMSWVWRLTYEIFLGAGLFTFLATIVIYIQKDMPTLNNEVLIALLDVFQFWFIIFWSLALLIALFRSVKYLFNSCKNGFKLELHSCQIKNLSTVIEDVGYGDIVNVWRKWLLLLIWIVASFMIFSIIITKSLSVDRELFDWFSIYILYGFILLAGYFSFVLLGMRCKKIRISRC